MLRCTLGDECPCSFHRARKRWLRFVCGVVRAYCFQLLTAEAANPGAFLLGDDTDAYEVRRRLVRDPSNDSEDYSRIKKHENSAMC